MYEIKGGEDIFNRWTHVFDDLDDIKANIIRCNSIVQNDMILSIDQIAESRNILLNELSDLDIEYKKTISEVSQLWNDAVKIMKALK